MTRSFIFPGQGSQFIGMGKELYDQYDAAKDVFDRVDEALGQKLSALIFGGDEADLNLTENTQPALMAVSIAVVEILKSQGVDLGKACTFMAGHSLGEYSALTAAGVFNLEDTARLLKLRGQAMQRAVPVGAGAMAAILGLEFEVVKNIAGQAGTDTLICDTANDNSVGQVVVSGDKAAVEAAVALATEQGAKRAVILPVSAPFHCRLMQPAAAEMAEALKDVEMNAPIVPIVTNVTAGAESDPDTLRTLLIEQITGMVRWHESVLWMGAQGVDEMVELGAGKVLSGLIRRIDKNITCHAAGTPEQLDGLVEVLS